MLQHNEKKDSGTSAFLWTDIYRTQLSSASVFLLAAFTCSSVTQAVILKTIANLSESIAEKIQPKNGLRFTFIVQTTIL